MAPAGIRRRFGLTGQAVCVHIDATPQTLLFSLGALVASQGGSGTRPETQPPNRTAAATAVSLT